jgi:hypothetical protein
MQECVEIMGELSFEAISDFDLKIVAADEVRFCSHEKKTPTVWFDVLLFFSPCVQGIGVTMDVILKLSERVVELSAEKSKRTEQIETIGEDIDHLWDVLDVPQEEREAFFDDVNGLSLEAIQRCESELQKLMGLKAAKMQVGGRWERRWERRWEKAL